MLVPASLDDGFYLKPTAYMQNALGLSVAATAHLRLFIGLLNVATKLSSNYLFMSCSDHFAVMTFFSIGDVNLNNRNKLLWGFLYGIQRS